MEKAPPLILLGGADAHDLVLVEILIDDYPNIIFVVLTSLNPIIPLRPRRSKLYIACSDLFYKSERAHAAAPPFQITTASLGCDLIFLNLKFRIL